MTLWHGRFEDGPAEELLRYTVSLGYDQRLWPDDIAGSRAHVRGLGRAGVLQGEEVHRVLAALDEVAGELESGSFLFAPSDEDIHTAVERRVTELAGEAGAKIHTGRSRNDQVATDMRLWVRRHLDLLMSRVVDLEEVLLARAEEAGDIYMPGYTHLQRAQPVLLAHHLLAHVWGLSRDVSRIADCRARMNVSPLGAGALAGSSIPLDPDGVAQDLGFAHRFPNSMDAVSDREFVAETIFCCTTVALHLARMGEELWLWSSDEFGFAVLDDAYATGSSMMPQKKNPDIAELARGKAGRVIGDLVSVVTMLKGLPLAYNRDLQEDKEPLFDAVDTVMGGLSALAGIYRTLRFVPEAMAEGADAPGAAATDLAEYLVLRGMPFRAAHAVVGGLVRESLEGELPLAELVAAHHDLGPEAAALLEAGVPVTRRRTPGGAGPGPVGAQLEAARRQVAADGQRPPA